MSHYILSDFFKNFTDFCVYIGASGFVLMGFLCVQTCMSLHLRFFYFFFDSFASICFILFWFSFCFILYYDDDDDTFFFPKDRQSVHLGGKGDGGDLGGIGKREVVIRIYCMKKPVSNKRKKKSGKKQNKQKIPPPNPTNQQ